MREKAARTVITHKPKLITAGVLPSCRTDVILSVYGEDNFAKLTDNHEKAVVTFKETHEISPKDRVEKSTPYSRETTPNMKPTETIQTRRDSNMNLSFAYSENQP